MTQAFTVKIPLCYKRANTFYKDNRKEWQFYDLATIWHVDPEKDGTDDSCGWFKRARHGNKEVLEKIIRDFTYDWDRVFEPSREEHDPDDGEFVRKTYYCGYFKPSGDPHLSVTAIVLNLFLIAANHHFSSDGTTNWRKSKRFMRRHLFDIMLFGENPCDSLFDTITRKFEKGCGEEYGNRNREERIRNMASIIYGWILRADQPWYRHARWHVHHWKIQIHAWQMFKRCWIEKCSVCGKGFKFKESVCGSWSGNAIWHDRCSNINKPSIDNAPNP